MAALIKIYSADTRRTKEELHTPSAHFQQYSWHKPTGMVLSGQNLAYAGSKLACGVLSDHVSPRLMFAMGLLLSSLFTFLLAAAPSVSAHLFTGLWFLNGCAQGSGWPALIKLLQQWFMPAQFGTLYGVLSASSNISLSIAPFLSSFLMLTYGWRVSVVATGVMCLCMGILSLFTVVDKPPDVGICLGAKPQDRDHSPSSPEKGDESGAASVNLLRSPFIWLLSGGYLTMFFARSGAVDWGQLYLIDDLKQSQFAANAFMSCIECGGFLGGIAAGYVTDWLLLWHISKGHQSGGNPRMPISVVLAAGATAGFHVFGYGITAKSSELFISVVGFALGACLYGAMAIFGVVASEHVPAHLSGTSHAIVAFGGSLGGVISGLPLSLVAERYSWSAVFLLLEVITALTALTLFAGLKFDSKLKPSVTGRQQKALAVVPASNQIVAADPHAQLERDEQLSLATAALPNGIS
ncbi:glucose-6-phosphate exchanger SLC37A4-like [Haemaphysalis longicornis]